MSGRPKKIPNVLKVIRELVGNGQYALTKHAEERMVEREVILPEVLHVLRTGWHEKRKDAYKPEYQDWDYAFRSSPRDERVIRVVVAIDSLTKALVITVIDLERESGD